MNDSHLGFPVVEEIVGFDVPMDDTKLMNVVQGLQQMIDVETDLLKAQRADDVLGGMFFSPITLRGFCLWDYYAFS